jgi:5-methylcytosine-specific restriction endonuclease McrA
VQKRASGAVVENVGACESCLAPLTGKYANAKLCGRGMCQTWAYRHPGVPHPSTQPRACKQCGASIDHLNGKAKFCPGECRNKWYAANDREGYNAKARAWQASEKGKATRRAYLQANADKRQAWARADRQKNPERYSGYWKQWSAANAEAVAEMGRMRRARQKGNPDSIGVPVAEWRKILNRYQGCCAYCGVKPDIIHMDHVVPLAKGGRHAAANVLPACPKCNLTKHAMFLSVWRYRGRRRSLSA